MRQASRKITLLLCATVLSSFSLAGCADYNRIADEAMEKACSIEGQTARDAYRVSRDAEFRRKDRAICVRCPGESALKCTGDPMALPAVQ